MVDPDGKEVIAPDDVSKQLVIKAVTYMCGKNHGYTFNGNKLVHNGVTPEGLSSGQQKMFSIFNDALVNSKTKTTILANQSISTVDNGNTLPQIVSLKPNEAGLTFPIDPYTKHASSNGINIPVHFDAQILILVPQQTNDGVHVMTFAGPMKVGPDHVASHEMAHGIVNTILYEFGGKYGDIDFNSMSSDTEREDWAIKFTNTLFRGSNKESGEGQHGRNSKTRPEYSLDGL